MNPDDTQKQDGGTIFDALAAVEGMPERGQPTGEQKREELSEEEPQSTAPDAESGRAYAEVAEDVKANPLFDLDVSHRLPPKHAEILTAQIQSLYVCCIG